MQNTLDISAGGYPHPAESLHLNKASLWSAIVFGTVAMLVFLLMPAYVGILASLGFNDAQLGNLASMDLAGITVASVLAMLWIKTANWRVAAILSMLGLIGANLLCLGTTDYMTLMALRLIAGLAAGTGIVLAFTIIANSDSPDRYTGLFVTIQVLAQSLGFVFAPTLIESAGSDSFYYLFALLALASIPLVAFIPSRHQKANDVTSTDESKKGSKLAVILALTSMTLFFLGQGAIWAFGDRIGVSGGLDSQAVANALALTAFASLFGALLSAWMDVKFGRTWPILIAILVQLAALTLFYGEMSSIYFTLLFSIFAFCWNFGIAFQVGVVASMDRTGRYTALIPAFQGAGLALGPFIAGIFLAGESYININIVSGFALAAYLFIILPLTKK
ncbi:MFS transporter [Marinobacterium sp. YM272]|uniref:MFS transporter n=1 Tax=Marinobacterium sp. YM272 TaxID=3421654 RepID=UPI003D7FADFC